MALDSKLDSDLKIFPSNTTLCQAIDEYLETRKKSIETWLLKKFKEHMQKKRDAYIKTITLDDFKGFLDSLSVSPALRKNYGYRLKRFQEYMELPESARASTRVALEKEREKNKAIIELLKYKIDTFIAESGEIEEIQQLQLKKAQIDEEIAKRNKIIEKQQIVKVRCPMKGFVVPFGNDCMHCDDWETCTKYGELTRPENMEEPKPSRA